MGWLVAARVLGQTHYAAFLTQQALCLAVVLPAFPLSLFALENERYNRKTNLARASEWERTRADAEQQTSIPTDTRPRPKTGLHSRNAEGRMWGKTFGGMMQNNGLYQSILFFSINKERAQMWKSGSGVQHNSQRPTCTQK